MKLLPLFIRTIHVHEYVPHTDETRFKRGNLTSFIIYERAAKQLEKRKSGRKK